MPILEYRCSACGATTEDLVLAGDAPSVPTCAACGSADVSRLLSTFAAHGEKGHSGDFPCGDDSCAMPDSCPRGGCGTGGGCGMDD